MQTFAESLIDLGDPWVVVVDREVAANADVGPTHGPRIQAAGE